MYPSIMGTLLALIAAPITFVVLLYTCIAVRRTSKQQNAAKSTSTSSAESRKSSRQWKTVQSNTPKRPLPPLPLSLEASHDFALSLLRASSEKEDNFVISPFSLGAALAIIHDGAKEETQGELTRLLGKSLSPSEVSSIYSSLTAALSETNSAVITSVANRFYLDKEFDLKSEYQSHIEKAYNTSAINMDFEDGNACANDANSFVNESTRGMIPAIATAEDFTDSVGVLINAVYFKGEWKAQFPKSATQSKAFHGIAGDRNEQFMRASARPTFYSLTDKLMVVSLEYKDPAYSLLVMMPSSDYGVWKANLTAIYLHEAMENLTNGKVNLEIPKWKIESSTDGKTAMEKCGVKSIFDKAADLSGISDEEFRISSIAHKAVIEVNEEGTEAAAVTKARMGRKCMSLTPKINLKFDSPFLYCLVRDKHILFIGEVC
ncbi:hypothetical protein PRIPAC_75407 [Pristionchus pacificus]|uniref:SERPIN domain-containing protein n=1 Tax=Pristionchus pacificus TaxID=54126 RepID=A0A2A6D006_PRIPA|nr:hypothetical protein PRIPAC_75407 [Pristionchus pacificus]|eukprot:PDM83647.1 hypothetical protein PRIPAC_30134 [Pristionchus pacificus]